VGLGIGGSGVFGLGFEAVYGTRVNATKFIPIRSESLTDNEDKQVLSPIRGVPTASHVKRGYKVVEGDVEFEITSDSIIYFLYLARCAIAKTGAGPYVYTFTPAATPFPTTAAGANTRKSGSLYVERGGQAFYYVGMNTTSFTFGIDNGDLIGTAHLMGLSLDTAQAPIAPTYSAFAPFGPGDIAISIPNAAPRVDIDTFSIQINDNGESLNRIRQGGAAVRGPSYIKWGEREVGGSYDYDFNTLDEYNAFNNNDFRTLRMNANHGAADIVQVDLANIISTTGGAINLGGMGDLVRSTIDFRAIYQGAAEYTIAVTTAESIT
jgi:Phage tail tube protein